MAKRKTNPVILTGVACVCLLGGYWLSLGPLVFAANSGWVPDWSEPAFEVYVTPASAALGVLVDPTTEKPTCPQPLASVVAVYVFYLKLWI